MELTAGLGLQVEVILNTVTAKSVSDMVWQLTQAKPCRVIMTMLDLIFPPCLRTDVREYYPHPQPLLNLTEPLHAHEANEFSTMAYWPLIVEHSLKCRKLQLISQNLLREDSWNPPISLYACYPIIPTFFPQQGALYAPTSLQM
ncbi:hypothetical protein KIL84_000515 [Mauremys mutica]|uniref:Uncharacterized protein n=1 Tax=Mauremys mutica TaxID=74926 RepID=A0A9D4AV03_9SAUR|nr:hypothetical protein KIL84_000515 [Mauremys mutica]